MSICKVFLQSAQERNHKECVLDEYYTENLYSVNVTIT